MLVALHLVSPAGGFLGSLGCATAGALGRMRALRSKDCDDALKAETVVA